LALVSRRRAFHSVFAPGLFPRRSTPESRVVARVAPELSRNSLAPRRDRSLKRTEISARRFKRSTDVSFTFIAYTFQHYGGS